MLEDLDIHPYCEVNSEFQTELFNEIITIPGIYKEDAIDEHIEKTTWANRVAFSADQDPETYLSDDFKKFGQRISFHVAYLQTRRCHQILLVHFAVVALR